MLEGKFHPAMREHHAQVADYIIGAIVVYSTTMNLTA